ncbi:uncharacterized protein LAESUDRAFT_726167 [Laetiporus sulphureus 93-53]|uniref:SET domain-containing protein n=1 Tax=Laetiporus sulphureus 93-53 TaxID=1314785 RepID=A0A165E6K6_9APHY|nr:uncharacterized protein LAESUDRAFT_726167 [Laetiporus sulphureus 93-53]KZT06337.1 hypothetical protein LAESUDRAFT_726167 [Laetiporus sulphureus 93-53]
MSTINPRESTSKPPRWPVHVQYCFEPRYHSSVPAEIRALVGPKASASGTKTTPFCRWTVIRRVTEPSHPACGEYGLYAVKKIPPRTHIVDYIGEIHCDERLHSDYDLSLYRTQHGLSVGVDAFAMGNEARFVNDYRGIKAKPNAVFEERRTHAGELRMSIWSSNEAIKKGEEILVSYGKMWWHARSVGKDQTSEGSHE